MARGDRAKRRTAGLAELYADLDKAIGKGLGYALADRPLDDRERVSTGLLSVDHATGGGFPYGAFVEVYGTESSGKTGLVTMTLGNIQRAGHLTAAIDAEHQLDPKWAAVLGLASDDLLLLQPDNAEQAWTAIRTYLQHGVRGIMLDSVAELQTEAQLKGEIGDATIGRLAALHSQVIPRLKKAVAEGKCCVMLINQLRANIGNNGYGPDETTPGGKIIRYAAGLRIDVRRFQQLKDGEDIVGFRAKVKIVKNRGPFGRVAKPPFLMDRGFDPALDLLLVAEDAGVFTRNGSWYRYGGDNIAQGMLRAGDWLRERPDLMAELRPRLLNFLETGDLETPPTAESIG